ncbi:hypothetical protein [Sulfitobacter pontiacus]|uniref:hypothetical protein n=1 Tax=Sulfitobacter pontiacus TaxID=60137 RepID=UPI0030ED0C1E
MTILFKGSMAFAFTLGLVLVYQLEISTRWAYYGFRSIETTGEIALAIILSTLLATLIPHRNDTRCVLLTFIHYLFFIPSIITAISWWNYTYILSIALSISLIFIFSTLELRRLKFMRFTKTQAMRHSLLACTLVVLALAATGGTRNFNLNILSVYDFRAESNASMPTLISYLFSGISKLVIPILLIFAIQLRQVMVAIFTLILVVLMFGMTHHKSVLFLPCVVGVLFMILSRSRNILYLPALFTLVVFVSLAEVLYAQQNQQIAFFTSFVTRRVFFLPPLLDTFYIDFFDQQKLLFWSTSRFGFGFMDNPYFTTAPHLIGDARFGSETTGANSGAVGSGFAHAGLLGVAVYSAIIGLLVAYLNANGKVIGHPLAASASLSIVMTIVNTSDLSTAVLTHGLLILLVIIVIMPRHSNSNTREGLSN